MHWGEGTHGTHWVQQGTGASILGVKDRPWAHTTQKVIHFSCNTLSSGIWEAAQKAKLSPCVVVLRNPTAVWEDSHTSERHYHPHILEGSTASLIFTLISLNFRHEGT